MINKRYEYKGKLYSDDREARKLDNYGGDLDELLFELEEDDEMSSTFCTFTVTHYYVGGEWVGSDEDSTNEDIVDYLVSYGYDGLEAVK